MMEFYSGELEAVDQSENAVVQFFQLFFAVALGFQLPFYL
jgi:hypothetical protein